jgi:hypothetical protein
MSKRGPAAAKLAAEARGDISKIQIEEINVEIICSGVVVVIVTRREKI